MADNLFTIAPGTSFVDALAAGLIARHGDDPAGLADVLILVPTRRSAKSLRDAFLRQSDGAALILPRMQPLGDVEEDELALDMPETGADAIDLPPAIPALQRHLLLTRLVRQAGTQVGAGSDEQAARLAQDLARLVDEVATNELDFDNLEELVEGDLASHWQTTLNFLKIVTDQWPNILAERGLVDPARRRSALLDALAARWRTKPPQTPVIAAGSTGTIPATTRLLATILGLPKGAVVLPGLDRHLDEAAWAAVDAAHPQAALKALLDHLDLAPGDVLDWPAPQDAAIPSGPADRAKVLSQAMLPASATTAWQYLEAPPDRTFDGLSLVVAAHQREEAQIAALIMRETLLTPHRTAALITRDRDLARRTAAELRRWDIEIDDSAGIPLADTVPGNFLRLVATVAAERAAPIPLLSLLKHPLAALAREPAQLRTLARRLERLALRGPRPASGFAALKRLLVRHEADAAVIALADELENVFNPLETVLAGQGSFKDMVGAHIACAEKLAASDNAAGPARLWAGEAGEAANRFAEDLLLHAATLDRTEGRNYAGLIATLMDGHVVRPVIGRHPRLFIWGPLEARLQHADRVILGGLNEANWPPETPADPWMSRPMRAQFGLPPVERRVGQAAHDFAQAAAARDVVLLRSDKAGGSPAVPARWLMRLETLMAAWNKRHLLEADSGRWRVWQALLDRPALVEPARPPEPAPPVADRPRRLSVTQIDTWLRDPYAVYARFVLGLDALDPLDDDPAAAERGTFIHEALDRFVKTYPDALPDDAAAELLKIGREVLGPTLEQPAVAGFWWPRFERLAGWFVAHEASRRTELAAIVTEAKAEMSFPAPAGEFTLSAKADRLERRLDGSIGVVDYKTGTVPSKKVLLAGGAPQLPLEAAMIQEGAFAELPERRIGALEHWQLQGGEPPGKVTGVAGDEADRVARATLDNLKRLVGAFDRPATPYRDHPDGEEPRAYDDYLLIARTEEHRLGANLIVPALTLPPVTSAIHTARPADKVQRRLSDPETSVWVAASAGTGKTKVLTDRVLRLLLMGVKPERILCLTFTRAAAAEMAVRIQRSLGHWAILLEPELAEALEGLTGRPSDEETLMRARTLFATTLDTPGGLKIVTIHAFCQSLLGRFPLEARVAPHFDLADERTAAELLRDARNRVLARIARSDDQALKSALETVAANAAESTFDEVIREITSHAGRLDACLAQHGGLDGTLAAIARSLDLEPGTDAASLIRKACEPDVFHERRLRDAATILAGGKKTDQTASAAIVDLFACDPDARAEYFDDYVKAFLTKEGEPRASLPTKAICDASPETASAIAAEQRRLSDLLDRMKAAQVLERTAAVLRLGDAILREFRDAKSDRALLDYDDLINQTNALLAQPDITPWVLYKLDGGIDHVLVDEAQDTSPAQWRIVLEIVREFFEGDGDEELARTVFVVGDEKQSIFSFQGADLDALRFVHDRLVTLAEENERRWYQSGLTTSFRSVSAVLASVDSIFANPAAKAGVVDPSDVLTHQVRRIGEGGLVELWPVVSDSGEQERDPWQAPLAYRQPENRSTRLAREIASTIDGWTSGEQQLASKGRRIQPGDVMVLVPRRTRFVHALVRELKGRGVPVAGVDRMDLTGQIAVKDLMMLGYACLMPDDDVALAAVLKGPLVDFDDDQLYDLARRRQGWERDGRGEAPLETLWAALRRRANDDPSYRAAHDWFAVQLGHADLERPFEFYCRVLSQPCPAPRGSTAGKHCSGREAMLRRLGIEAEDPLDEFLAATLEYEREHTAALQGLLAWIETGSTEIKREMEARHDMVRIMTVHGAKGLQAPIVFLADDMAANAPREDNLVWLDGVDLPLWPGGSGKRDSLSDEAVQARRERQAEERRRLLYVALTRAEDRLYVTAAAAKPAIAPDSWHALVEAGLAGIAEPFPFEASGDPAWTGQGLRYAVAQTATPFGAAPVATVDGGAPKLAPELLARAPAERDADRPLNPSRLGGAERAPESPLAGGGDAARRGRIVHRLLELLPAVAPDGRGGAAARLARHLAADWPDDRRARLCADVLAILSDRTFAHLFGPDSRAEVPIVGRLDDLVIAGQVDRLVVGPTSVDIVDFKSNRAPPENDAAIPEAYLRQLAAYRAVLSRIYPQREVRCLLLWTAQPLLQPVPQDLLDAYAP